MKLRKTTTAATTPNSDGVSSRARTITETKLTALLPSRLAPAQSRPWRVDWPQLGALTGVEPVRSSLKCRHPPAELNPTVAARFRRAILGHRMQTGTRTQAEAHAPAVRAAADALHPDAGPAYWFCKRLFDIAFSATALIVAGIPMLIVALWVKLDDRSGPVFFRQSRTGLGGRRFNLLKYRTMVSN